MLLWLLLLPKLLAVFVAILVALAKMRLLLLQLQAAALLGVLIMPQTGPSMGGSFLGLRLQLQLWLWLWLWFGLARLGLVFT